MTEAGPVDLIDDDVDDLDDILPPPPEGKHRLGLCCAFVPLCLCACLPLCLFAFVPLWL